MSTQVVEENVTGRSGEEASPPISPSMECVLPIRGVDADTGEVVAIPTMKEAEDPYRADVVRCDFYNGGGSYEIALGRFGSNPGVSEWMGSDGWGSLSAVSPFIRNRNDFSRVPDYLPTEKVVEEEGQDALPRCELSREIVEVLHSIYQASLATRRYEFILNRHRCLIELGLMTMDKEKCPRPALARLNKQKPRALVAGSPKEVRQKKVLEDMSQEENREAVQVSNVIEVDDFSAPEGDAPLSRKTKSRASRTGAPQGNVVEIVDNYAACSAPPLQRTLAVNTSGEMVLEEPPKLSQKLGGTERGPYESKRRLRELIGAPGARIPDDVLWNVPFYPSMGAQDVKKYFTPKWEEFSSHGKLDDVLEASLASVIKASAMQIKVLGEFRTHMQEQRNLSVVASKSDKEHRQALEGLQAALDSARMAYEQMEADLKESNSNVLNLTKQLDNANVA
ncbi:hypothetical protein Adt_45027 [Abeliophyllum distichum]|uniref:Uncharacterized protein n=1 Tax=Abeliophyllum distichum TaxID=126358 RepID=A0ABD1PCM4_9LAMI